MNMHGIPQYTLVWGARYTIGARYLSKNTVHWEVGRAKDLSTHMT